MHGVNAHRFAFRASGSAEQLSLGATRMSKGEGDSVVFVPCFHFFARKNVFLGAVGLESLAKVRGNAW